MELSFHELGYSEQLLHAAVRQDLAQSDRGAKPDMAQGGGKDVSQSEEALDTAQRSVI